MLRWRETLLELGRTFLVSAALGVALAYIFFQTIFPSLSVPITERIPPWLFTLIFLLMGFLAGILLDSLEAVAVMSILSVIIGAVGAYFIFVSPTAAEEVTGEASEAFFAVIRMTIPLVLLGIIAIFTGGFLGQWFYQNAESREEKPSIFDRTASRER